MCLKQSHKPHMTGNGKHTTYGDDWGMVYYCFTHIIPCHIFLVNFIQHVLPIMGKAEASTISAVGKGHFSPILMQLISMSIFGKCLTC